MATVRLDIPTDQLAPDVRELVAIARELAAAGPGLDPALARSLWRMTEAAAVQVKCGKESEALATLRAARLLLPGA